MGKSYDVSFSLRYFQNCILKHVKSDYVKHTGFLLSKATPHFSKNLLSVSTVTYRNCQAKLQTSNNTMIYIILEILFHILEHILENTLPILFNVCQYKVLYFGYSST